MVRPLNKCVVWARAVPQMGGTADGAGHVFQPAETIRPDEADITFVAAAGPFSGIIWRCVGIDIGQ